MEKNLAELRESYDKNELLEDQCPENPYILIQKWLEEATISIEKDANAMFLSTVGKDGQPSSRTVLLKEVHEDKFIFYTNYKGRKGTQMAENPKVSLLFWWKELERQIRIEGIVQKVPKEVSETYFHSRPYGSQIGATASPQSQITTKDQLIENFKFIEEKYKDQDELPLPDHWGGYAVTAHLIEFWQGRPNRMHDRVEYMLDNQIWIKVRLAP
ncbi:MAG TPA: pyridoxamine 5'-phosphate oxidase [Chitinophagales bacterium]|nr:pyridoxamine 5'-phosphate oxidase [Chitinophagales bacterium]